MKKLMRRHGSAKTVDTDGLRFDRAAMKAIGNAAVGLAAPSIPTAGTKVFTVSLLAEQRAGGPTAHRQER